MKTPLNHNSKSHSGIVAILDALGTSKYDDKKIIEFISARKSVLSDFNEKFSEAGKKFEIKDIDKSVKIFTFNDTVIITFKFSAIITSEIDTGRLHIFLIAIRKMFYDSLKKDILFRGSIALGSFYIDEESNTVMGQAITDAAAWYNKSNWIGVHMTPRTYLITKNADLDIDKDTINYYLIEYNIPMVDASTLHSYCINWPKAFYVKTINENYDDKINQKNELLKILLKQMIVGVENKYINTINFFDAAEKIRERILIRQKKARKSK